ncbi:hypothetical protein [Roseateles sp. MS654]|uniref:hypothetical protein n=1 Tax=Roseateles sp. MS654 TaxID=3412685 RepID=UPI003C2F27CC
MNTVELVAKRERLQLLYAALGKAQRPTTLQGAWGLIDTLLADVEDRYTTVPNNRQHYGGGRRMFLPTFAVHKAWSRKEGWHVGSLMDHQVHLSDDGRIRIWHTKTERFEFELM